MANVLFLLCAIPSDPQNRYYGRLQESRDRQHLVLRFQLTPYIHGLLLLNFLKSRHHRLQVLNERVFVEIPLAVKESSNV